MSRGSIRSLLINKMAARQVGKRVFDWASILAKLPAEFKPEFHVFRNKYEAIKAGLNAYPATPDPIDWDYYKSKLSTKSALVDSFKKQYTSLNVPYPKDVETAAINERKKKLDLHSEAKIKKANENVKLLEEKLGELRSMKPFEEMTIEEHAELYPEIKKQVEEDVWNYRWTRQDP